ncbi:MAG TPA: transcriptional regulator GcvA [Polyangiaceae bacterium]
MALRLPPMQALRAFEAAARVQSLTKAAESLHLTHGAISHQIKALEEDLGVRLVERAGRGIRLTDEGERFASRVRAALSELAEAVREISERSNPRQLRVSMVPSFAARWLLPRIGRFVAAHPDIDLDVRANPALVDFRRDDVDAAIRYGLGQWPGVIAEHLFDDIFFPVCSPRFAGGRLPRRPVDLSRYPLMRSEGELWKPWFEAAGLDWPEPSRGPMFSDSSHMLQAAAEGQGIALARSALIGSDLINGVLVRLFDVMLPSQMKFFLVYPPRLADSPKLASFRNWLRDEIAADKSGSTPGANRKTVRRGSSSASGAHRR